MDLLFGHNEPKIAADQDDAADAQKFPEETYKSFDPNGLIDLDLFFNQDLFRELGDLDSFPTNWGFDL